MSKLFENTRDHWTSTIWSAQASSSTAKGGLEPIEVLHDAGSAHSYVKFQNILMVAYDMEYARRPYQAVYGKYFSVKFSDFGKGLPYGVEMISLSVPAALRKDSLRGKTNTRVARMARADAIGDVEAVLKLATEIPTAIHKKKSEEGAPCLACHFLFLSALSRSGRVINNKQRVLLVFPP